MPRNVLIATSTNTQEMYNINVAYLPPAYELGAWFTIPAGRRHYVYKGCCSMVQLLHVLWPLLESANDMWQEFYMYQNSYPGDIPHSATIHTRHSMCPTHWVKCVVGSMAGGTGFYDSFWDFVVRAPAWTMAFGMNYDDYVLERIIGAGGPHDLLWPSIPYRGRKAFWVLVNLILKTHGTRIPVPMSFIEDLEALHKKWEAQQSPM